MNLMDNTGRNLKKAFNNSKKDIIKDTNNVPLKWHEREPDKNPKYATIPCKWGSRCPYGSKCAFAHGDVINYESQETKDKRALVLSKRLQLEKENKELKEKLKKKTENEIKIASQYIKISRELQNCKLQLKKYDQYYFLKDVAA